MARLAMRASHPQLPWYPVARTLLPWLARSPWLTWYLLPHGHPATRHSVLAWHPVLARNCALARVCPLLDVRMLSDPDALADPDRAGPEHAPKLAGARRIEALAGAQREVLMIAGEVAGAVGGAARLLACQCRVLPCGPSMMEPTVIRRGEPVVRIRPRRGLLGIRARRADPLRELGQLVPATLADCGERHRVPGQIERDLVRLADPIAATYSLNRQHRTINATQRPHNGTLTSR
jgi:hypothetical protein